MPESHASRGARRGRRLLADLGDEIRAARKASGISQAAVATAAGLSSSEVSRIEQGGSPWLDIVTASRICAVVGLDLSVRSFPGPNPVRDAAHVRLIDAFRARLGAGLVARTEVPIGRERDLRAWDVTTTDSRATAAAEFETRLTDAQALTRRVTLKCRDSGIAIVILVVSDTANNRDAVASPGPTCGPCSHSTRARSCAHLRQVGSRMPAGSSLSEAPLSNQRQPALRALQQICANNSLFCPRHGPKRRPPRTPARTAGAGTLGARPARHCARSTGTPGPAVGRAQESNERAAGGPLVSVVLEGAPVRPATGSVRGWAGRGRR